MRTTVRLADDLLAEAKAHAACSGCTLTAFIEDSLRRALSEARRRPERPLPKLPTFQLPTFRGDGLQQGVDLDDSAALLDLMEGR